MNKIPASPNVPDVFAGKNSESRDREAHQDQEPFSCASISGIQASARSSFPSSIPLHHVLQQESTSILSSQNSGRPATPSETAGLQQIQFQALEALRERANSCMPAEILEHSAQLRESRLAEPASSSFIFSSPQASAPLTKVENVELANNVSLQIFSTPETNKTNNVVVFLHGGPGLEYDKEFEPVTNWFISHGYTLVALEIAGSAKPGLENKSNSHSRNYVRDLKSIMQCLQQRPDMQSKDVCVVAHSWGGFQLASLLTDETAEERKFFKQAVFISANLDSAQTRLFADADGYDEKNEMSLFRSFEPELLRNFNERHTGSDEEMDESARMSVINNPLIDQTLNEKFSPFYQLEKISAELPCLFFHATNDKQVPVSQSVDAFSAMSAAGGNARVLISTRGGHSFFKAGKESDPDTMESCFNAIDALVKRPESLEKVIIDGCAFSSLDSAGIEKELQRADTNYENYGVILRNFHQGFESPARQNQKRIPPKAQLLRKLAEARKKELVRLATNAGPAAAKNRARYQHSLQLINEALEKQ
jgi:pimeloyl-ACP methyl ester carboxylesterase